MQRKRQLLDSLAKLDEGLESLGLSQKRDYNLKSPLGRLPDEILAIIFSEIVDLIRDEQSERTRAHLLSTCHRWLNVGLRTPRIWNQIIVYRRIYISISARIYTRYPHSYLRAQLARSKSAPLGIWIHTEDTRELKTLFLLSEPYLHRTQILHILIPPGPDMILDFPQIFATLSNCRDLSISCRPDQTSLSALLPSPNQIPKLTTLYLGGEYALLPNDPQPMPSNVSYAGITHLYLGAFLPQNIVELLGLCSALKCLAVRGLRGMMLEAGPIVPLTLPHLEHLDVQGQFEPYFMSSQFEAPRLESLSLLGDRQYFVGGDTQKFAELRCASLNPQFLRRGIVSSTPTFLAEFLHHHPKLEWLTLIPRPQLRNVLLMFPEDDEEPEVEEIHPSLYEALYTLLPLTAKSETRWPNFRTLVVHGAHISERSLKYEAHLRELIAVVRQIRSTMPQEIFVYFPGSVSKRFLERVLDLPYNPFIAPSLPEDQDPRWAQRHLFAKK